ncbi:hypothetical protein EX30DRAFT_339411 [Ascodesmis nigricans]|uniref:Mitochondrial escape protein 2 n=1 Tax=Ascodesmis nigricans TaxID=341454 RepID=A0A4S2N2D9_9PEZI|nr:hypothetical protein EX30DRAFT_339411 [Ascodesmis nigricans]
MSRLMSSQRHSSRQLLVPRALYSPLLRPIHLSRYSPPATQFERSAATIKQYKAGFIDVVPGESLLYFDNVFPLKTAVWDARYLMMRMDPSSLESRIKDQCIPPDLQGDSSRFEITSIVPRLKDGGAFVKFKSSNPKEVEKHVQKYLQDRTFKPWFSPLTRVRSYLVQGKPWLEDLYRFPSARLKIEFVPNEHGTTELSQEALYALFRPYGKIADIVVSPSGSKELPKSAIITFLRMRAATAARNCLHGFTVPEIQAIAGKEGGVTLRILYDRVVKTRWIKEWFIKHPRIVLPILAAILATITVSVFDPIRTWFIEAKVTKALDLKSSKYWGWVKSNTIGRFEHKSANDGVDISALWDERKDSINQLTGWLAESEETFIVVQGPRGCGKRELVIDSVLNDRKNVLIVDCEPIHEAHGDTATIAAAAAQVGYRPVFSWINSISSLVDLAAQGAIGTSAGFSQTLENQFNKILQNTGTALKNIALAEKKDNPKDEALADDEYLAAHPERRPVVVIDNFLHISSDSIIYSRLADWAALLVSSNVAHVIFLTNDITFSKSLSKSLPDRVFRTIFLGDATPDSAQKYVLAHIAGDQDTGHQEKNKNLSALKEPEKDQKFMSGLAQAIKALGGRLTDLEFLSRRIKLGETPEQAVTEIINTSATEILKLHLTPSQTRKWSPPQAWLLISLLAQRDIGYNSTILNDLFASPQEGDDILQSLESAELISVEVEKGLPRLVKPGKPVYREAFRRLTEDRILKAKMEMETRKVLVKDAEKKIEKWEDELEKIVPLGKGMNQRVDYLTGKVKEMQKKVEGWDKELKVLKKVLVTEG